MADGDLTTVQAFPARFAARFDRIDVRSPWLIAAAVGLAILGWPYVAHPRPSIDLSWQLGLHQAIQSGLQFGDEIVFTYGPLGFLSSPTPFVGPTSLLAMVVALVAYGATIWMLLFAMRRMFPLWVALLLGLLFARVVGTIWLFEVVQLLVFMVGVELLRRDHVARSTPVAALLGIVAAITLLGKLNVGVFVSAMAIVIIAGISRRRGRDLLILGGTFAASGLALWLATGQGLPELLSYARASIDIISGYSEAMATYNGSQGWVLTAFVLVGAMVVWAAYRLSADWSRPRRLALGVLVATLLFAVWKHGFVRAHVAVTFAELAFMLAVVMPQTLPRSTVIAMLLASGVAYFGASLAPPTRYADIPTSVVQFARQASDSFLPWRWDATTASTRLYLAKSFGVPSDLLALLDGRTIHIDPYEAAVATAYPTFIWQPEPIFQSYSAYTPFLDGLNADALRAPDRPARILRHFKFRVDSTGAVPSAVDGRFYWFESPAAMVERLCRYREMAATARWQVLADTGRECGAPRPIGTVTAALGKPVTVPAAPSPGDLVVVRIHGLEGDLATRLRSVLWKGPEWQIKLDERSYRLVAATAGDGLVLAVPAFAQGSAPFSFGPSVGTIAVTRKERRGSGPITYEFLALPMPGS